MINAKYFMLLLVMLTNLHSFCQDSLDIIQWEYPDSSGKRSFANKAEAIKWAETQMPFPHSDTNDFLINNHNVCIVIVSGFSGLIRESIFVFTEKNNTWLLTVRTKSYVFAKNKIEVELDDDNRRVIFQAVPIGALRKTLPIEGELPFEIFD